MRGSGRYLPALDGLRAVAVCMVVVHHAWPDSAFAGRVGVDVFFVLSGYLITSILLAEQTTTGSIALGRFWIRRLFRLYPALIAMVLATVLFFPLLGLGLTHVVRYGGPTLTYTTNIVNALGGGVAPFGHTWSLAQEEQFYLVWPPMLLLALRGGRSARPLVAGLVVLAAGSLALSPMVDDRNTLGRSGGILLGVVLAILLTRAPRRVPTAVGWAGVAGLVGSLVLCSAVGAADRFAVVAVTLSSVAMTAFVAAGGTAAWTRALAWRPVVWVGLVSYSLYLWHYPLIFVLREGYGWTNTWITVVGIPLSFAMAAASFYLVERPGLALRDRWFAARSTREREATEARLGLGSEPHTVGAPGPVGVESGSRT